MNHLPVIVAASLASGVVFAESLPLYEQPVLKALGQIETGEQDFAVGLLGEKSRYQIRAMTWKENSNKPYAYSYKPEVAAAVALNYLNRLSNMYYTSQHKRPTELDLYIMWNWGFNNYARVNFEFARAPHSSRDAAQRFANLIYKFNSKN